jgi:rSAM/selenodomain-associated transferase 2
VANNRDVPLASVIIPVLPDDVECLERTLGALGDPPRAEIIVVNGGEWTPRLAALGRGAHHVRWLSSPRGRARQMNSGAKDARGDWLVFLHADTVIGPGWLESLERLGDTGDLAGGCFRFELDSGSRWARAVERGVAARVRWCNLPYGDQALFARRNVFERLGGYRELPLMEDVDLVRRLRRIGRLYHSDVRATTSARRWEADGWIRRSVENMAMVLLFFAGVDPERLARRYHRRSRFAGRKTTGHVAP